MRAGRIHITAREHSTPERLANKRLKRTAEKRGRLAAGRYADIIGVVPEVSRFLGIVIYFYYRDHPPAHFHAEYGEYEITVDINTGIVTGKFPRRALNAVLEWYELHKEELADDWQRARQELPLNRIEPLE